MNWRLFARAIWLRGGIAWLVATHYRMLPRRLPGPWFFSRYAVRSNSKSQGRKDGRLGLPTAEQMTGAEPDYPGHLLYLKNEGDRLVRAVLAAMLKMDTHRGGRSAAISHVRQLINHANDERSALATSTNQLNSNRAELDSKRDDFKEAEHALAAAKKRRRTVDVWSRGLPRRAYKSLLLALTVAELPLLALAFQNFFSVAFSVIVSVGVSVAIIFCAHVAGILLHKRESVLLPGDTRILAAIWTAVVAAIVGLSFVRELYLETTSQAGVSTGPAWVVVIVFAMLNVLVFGAAVLVSKFNHSECAEQVDDARRTVRSAKRDIRRHEKREKKSHKRVARNADRIVLLEGLATRTSQRARTSVDQAKLAAAGQKDFIEECYALYVRENTRSQAQRSARRAGLRQPVASGPLPEFVHLPKVKDPDVEFLPFVQKVNTDLETLERLLAQAEVPIRTLRTRAGDVPKNGSSPEPAAVPTHAP
jgi:hypothetical protein